jgi:hypothetical protein
MYSGQTNNWYDKQMRNMREQILSDKNNVYSYGQNHLSLSIDPVNPDDKRKHESKLDRTPV